MRASRNRVGTLRRLVLAALVSALFCAMPGLARAAGTATFLQRAEALQNKLNAWQQTLNKMNFDEVSLQTLSLSAKRGDCVKWMQITEGTITRLEKKPTLGMEALLLSDLTSLDNRFLNLSHVLELARVTQNLTGQPAVDTAQLKEKVASLRAELEASLGELSSGMLQQFRVADEASQPKGRQVLHQPGEISGYIYRADTGQPLVDVVVTLESPLFPNGDKLKRSARDGSYKFGGLAPGNYWVIAYKSGFVGLVYGMEGSQRVSIGLISVAAGQKHENVDLHLNPVPKITELSNQTVAAAIPGQDLRFVYGPSTVQAGSAYVLQPSRLRFLYGPGAFSPDGKQFAFGVADATPEQVCLYNLDSRGLKCSSMPQEQEAQVSSGINYFAWVGNTLYAETGFLGGARFFTVTPAGVQPLLTMTSAGMQPFRPPPLSILQAFHRENNHAGGAGVFHLVGMNPHFMITAWYGHLVMQTRDGENPYRIATGGRELYSFLFDSDRSVVFYPVSGRYNGAIVVFDLNARQSQSVALPFSIGLKLLDETRKPNSTVVAYAVDGPCVPKVSATGENPWILPNKPLPARQPTHICFVNVPFGRQNE